MPDLRQNLVNSDQRPRKACLPRFTDIGSVHGFPGNVSSRLTDETIVVSGETIFSLARRDPETADDYQLSSAAGGQRRSTGGGQMRTFSFIVTFVCILVGPSMAGSSEIGLPGAGAFSYRGSAVVSDGTQPMIVASR